MSINKDDFLDQAEEWRIVADLNEFRTPSLKDDPNHWLKRAEEALAIAEVMTAPETKQKMEGIAETYVRLAEHAEARARQKISIYLGVEQQFPLNGDGKELPTSGSS